MNQHIFESQLISVKASDGYVYRTIVKNNIQFALFIDAVKKEVGSDKIDYTTSSEAATLCDIQKYKDTFSLTGKEWRELPLWEQYKHIVDWYISFRIGEMYFKSGCLVHTQKP